MTMPGPMEIGLIVLLIVVVFGAKRIPHLGKGLGQGIRNFKKALSGQETDSNEQKSLEDTKEE